MSVDLAATHAPVMAPLRDWLRAQLVASVGNDGTHAQVYAGGLPTSVRLSTGPAISLQTAGGLDGGTVHDRPFVRFNVWAEGAAAAETCAYALRAVLERVTPGTALGSSQVRLSGAETDPPIFSPDPDTNTPRFIVTSTLTVQAVST